MLAIPKIESVAKKIIVQSMMQFSYSMPLKERGANEENKTTFHTANEAHQIKPRQTKNIFESSLFLNECALRVRTTPT